MALPRGTTGSLGPTFVSARPVGLAVRRACALALERLVSDQPEPTIARLRYALGGDRPSQTTRHAGSRTRITGRGETASASRVVFQGRLHPSWRLGFVGSHLSYT